MRPVWLAAAGILLAIPAWAQRSAVQVTPLPPLQQQQQDRSASPSSPSGGQRQYFADPGGAPGQAVPPRSETPPAVTDHSNAWLPSKAVKIQALDKVNAQATMLTIKVGQSATFGSLTINPKACVVRPADQPADAAAYLTVTDSHADSSGFDGWMMADEPAVSMMEHPVYDLRVTGCT